MVNYESLLLGGGKKGGGGQTREQLLANLAKGRAVRAANLAAKKKGGMHPKRVKGAGQYNQDYVDESQINYMGSPLDMYYLGSAKEMEHEKEQRGEIGMGAKRRGRKPKVEEIDEDEMVKGGNLYSGMDRPTAEQFKRGGKIAKKGRKKIDIDDLEGGAMEKGVNIPDAIKVLGMLASKFGLKLSK